MYIFVQVTGEGRKRNQISVGSCSEVTLPGKVNDNDIRSLNASIQVVLYHNLNINLFIKASRGAVVQVCDCQHGGFDSHARK